MMTSALLDRSFIRPSLPQQAKGRYRSIKTAVSAVLLTLFFVLPWIRWDRGALLPDQAVLFDLGSRRLFILGLEFWTQDLPIAVGALVLGAFGLFYATTLAGRVWCGFTCPQTVWTDIFNGVDRLCGRLLGRNSLGARVLQMSLWLLIAVCTGIGFAAYFSNAMTLPRELVTGAASPGIYLTIGILTLTTWLFAAYARERICLHMCPWPRFQAALMDRDSLVVTYQEWRGEPRGKKKKPPQGAGDHGLMALARQAADFSNVMQAPPKGDCIDCRRCVNVCPTGIDIREGLQMGCIGCGLCIDACNDIMTKIDRPTGLIRFDTEAAETRRSMAPPKVNPWRPKSLLYAVLCLFATGGMAYGIAAMPAVMLDVEPQRNPPFIRLSDGSVRNDYTLRLAHRLPALDAVTITSTGISGAQLRLQSNEETIGAALAVDVPPTRQLSDRLFLVVPASELRPGRVAINVVFTDARTGENLATVETYFWGPER